MRKLYWISAVALLGACNSSSGGGDTIDAAMMVDDAGNIIDAAKQPDGSTVPDGSTMRDGSTITPDGSTSTCGSCGTGFTCNAGGICVNGAGVPQFDHVYVIMMENRSLSAITQSSSPNLYTLLQNNATAAAYNSVAHPSLPNYIALTSGGTQSITCDCSPDQGGACNIACLVFPNCNCGSKPVQNLGDTLEAASITWRMYGQGMGTPCNTTEAGSYKDKHIPFLYYDSITNTTTHPGRCTAHVRDLADFTADLAAQSYRFTMISPDQCHDMHDSCAPTNDAIKQGDDYLGMLVPTIQAKLGARDVLFIVWDEQDNSIGNAPLPFIVISPLAKKASETGARDHYSLLRTIEDGFGLTTHLGSAASATPFTQIWK